jgi:hypothetical protein
VDFWRETLGESRIADDRRRFTQRARREEQKWKW